MAQKKYQTHVLVAVKTVKELINQNPANGVSSTALANGAGLSRRILHQAFKDEFGIKIGAYKLKCRMMLAQKLLLMGSSVKEVALQLHYASISSFSDAFKNYFGFSPTEWQTSEDVAQNPNNLNKT